jgi:endothelin-converting enzyme/putative endopeptidase
VDWWTAEDSKQFSALTQHLLTIQCSEPLPGTLLMVNLLWENIGDLGGINAAYDGLQLYLKKMETRAIDGYTRATFLYFLGNNLETKARDEAIKNQVKQIHILQECTVLMYHCKTWIPLSGVRYSINDGMYMHQRKS